MSSTSDPTPPSPAAARSRYGNVVNAAELPWEPWGHPGGRYGGQAREAARALGAKHLGYHLEILAPGMISAPFHFHHHEEELFYVLEGRGLLRQGKPDEIEEIELGPGDFVAFPPDTGIAHHFRNPTDKPFVFLALSNIVPHDVAEFPDSDKIILRQKRIILRRQPTLDYWDGEA